MRVVKSKSFTAVFPRRWNVGLTFEADSAEDLREDCLAFYRDDPCMPIPSRIRLADAWITEDARDVLHAEWNTEHKKRKKYERFLT